MKRRLGLGIVVVAKDLGPRGPARYAQTISRALAEMGPSVLLLTGGAPAGAAEQPAAQAGLEVRAAPELFRPLVGWLHARWQARALPVGYRLVHAAEAAAVKVAGRLAAALDAASVLTVHSYEEADGLRGVTVGAGRVIAVGEALRAYLVNEVGLPRERLVAIPDGVDVERFRVEPAFEPAGRRPVVGWLGRLVSHKRPLEFLRAAATVAEKQPDVEFLVAGEGPLKEAVRTLAVDLGLRDRTTFVFEGMAPEAVLPVMDVFVSTSAREGLGLAVIEAMAAGKPVVATAQGGHFDVVRDGKSGLLYPPDDTAACADRILQLLAAPEKAREMGMTGREVAAKQYDARKVAGRLLETYDEVLAAAG